MLEITQIAIFTRNILKSKSILFSLNWKLSFPISKEKVAIKVPNNILTRFQLKVNSILKSSNYNGLNKLWRINAKAFINLLGYCLILFKLAIVLGGLVRKIRWNLQFFKNLILKIIFYARYLPFCVLYKYFSKMLWSFLYLIDYCLLSLLLYFLLFYFSLMFRLSSFLFLLIFHPIIWINSIFNLRSLSFIRDFFRSTKKPYISITMLMRLISITWWMKIHNLISFPIVKFPAKRSSCINCSIFPLFRIYFPVSNISLRNLMLAYCCLWIFYA